MTDHGRSQGYFTEKYASTAEETRTGCITAEKRHRLELKQERLTQKGAREAAESDTYQSGTFISNSMFFSPPYVEMFLDNLNFNCRSEYDSRCRHREYP